jgi:hypothetical protein
MTIKERILHEPFTSLGCLVVLFVCIVVYYCSSQVVGVGVLQNLEYCPSGWSTRSGYVVTIKMKDGNVFKRFLTENQIKCTTIGKKVVVVKFPLDNTFTLKISPENVE